ncbi:MAG TPA: zinc dependent phospholipase C family protein [Vicinamibacteria bacterium]|nr:zinc dependent phospholipase C family protein [Vicinamibacteria bacterium]
MPGPYIHISSMRHAALRLASGRFEIRGSERVNSKWTGLDPRLVGRLIHDHPNFASLGAIGPDLFFFLPDFRDEGGVQISSVLVTVLKFLEDVYGAMDPYISKWEHYLGPISEDTAEEMSRLTGGLSETVGDIAGELSSILITALEDFVVRQEDWWSFFSLGLDKGFDEKAFFWSDMLHYRNTGQFARALWTNADRLQSDTARAYALGYITHVATDVTGHAFVNSISGGPFRLHWQRHHLVENHMDAHWYLNDSISPHSGDNYGQLTESALYYDIAFDEETNGAVDRPTYPTGKTLRENWERKRLLDIDSKIPPELPALLIQAMNDIWYPDGKHPLILDPGDGLPQPDMIGEAYDLFFRYLKLVTVDGFSHEPPDPPDVFPNLDFPTMNDPAGDAAPGDGGGGGSFWDDLLDFILSIVAVIAYIVEVAVYLATLPWAILADLITYPLRLGLYYALELPLFHLLKSFRAALVMTGYMLPMDDEIAQILILVGNSESGVFTEVLQLDGDVFAGWLPPPQPRVPAQTYRDPAYPHSIPTDGDDSPDEFRHPWSYPISVTEKHWTEFAPAPPTTSGPHPAGAGPGVLFGATGTDPTIRDRFEGARSPGEADRVGMDVTPNQHLGDAVAFTEYMLWLASRDPQQKDGSKVPMTEWNLDSDCGYGYHCWDWNRRTDATDKDPEGFDYARPCTPPPQTNQSFLGPISWDAGVPLQLHWDGPGLDDPHCQPPPVPAPANAGRNVMAKEPAKRGGGRGRRAKGGKR